MGLFSRLRSSIKRIADEVRERIEDVKDMLGIGDDDDSIAPDAPLLDDEDIYRAIEEEIDTDEGYASYLDMDMVAFEYDGDAMEGVEDGKHYYTTDYIITLVTGAEIHGSIKFYGEGDNICAGILASNPDLQSTDILMIDVLDYPEYSLVNGFSSI